MAYRSGTYAAFHAAGTSDPTASDIKYYNLLRAWRERDDYEFRFINSHEKAEVRDSSSRETLRRRLAERLRNSRNMVLILGETTRFDTDWVPYEISYAIDGCAIPIIAAYPGYRAILNPASHRTKWPRALADRIDDGTAYVIHVPFKREPLNAAIAQFDHDNLPTDGLTYYLRETYRNKFGIDPD